MKGKTVMKITLKPISNNLANFDAILMQFSVEVSNGTISFYLWNNVLLVINSVSQRSPHTACKKRSYGFDARGKSKS